MNPFIHHPFYEADFRRDSLIPFPEGDDIPQRHCALPKINDPNLLNKILAHEMLEIQSKLKHQEKFASMGKAAGTLIYELLSPLDGVRRYLHLAQIRNLNDCQRLEYVKEADKGVERMLEIMKTILSFSSSLFSEPVFVDMNELIEKTLMEFQPRSSKIKVQTFYDPRLTVSTLPAFEFVLHNLIKNSYEAMPEGGSLIISTQRYSQHAKIFIRDHGGGIAPDCEDKIFEPFFTTKREQGGLGLGLTIAKEIVEQSQGRLMLINEFGKGVTWIIDLPTQPENKKGDWSHDRTTQNSCN